MDVDRETVVEVVISVLAVFGFIAAVVLVGLTYGTDGLGDQGALALVGLVVAFIVLMSITGYWLSAREA